MFGLKNRGKNISLIDSDNIFYGMKQKIYIKLKKKKKKEEVYFQNFKWFQFFVFKFCMIRPIRTTLLHKVSCTKLYVKTNCSHFIQKLFYPNSFLEERPLFDIMEYAFNFHVASFRRNNDHGHVDYVCSPCWCAKNFNRWLFCVKNKLNSIFQSKKKKKKKMLYSFQYFFLST